MYTYIYIYTHMCVLSRAAPQPAQSRRALAPSRITANFQAKNLKFGVRVKRILTQRRWAFLAHRLISCALAPSRITAIDRPRIVCNDP